eukprot:TRINITY_DN10753_c0_g1_i1.p1 TRINITY_DN10753_c0_g1~~TRINITY_DN10753_c0_g1_i1.p1  ORF type:complete len:234 (+),score=47.92 TRINITY_DN10753_c0_g1_i1:755-1456(+)
MGTLTVPYVAKPGVSKSDFREVAVHELRMKKNASCFYLHKLVKMGEEWTDDQVEGLIKMHEGKEEAIGGDRDMALPPPQKVRKLSRWGWVKSTLGGLLWGGVGTSGPPPTDTSGEISHTVGEKRPFNEAFAPTPAPADVTASHWGTLPSTINVPKPQPSSVPITAPAATTPLLEYNEGPTHLPIGTKVIVELPEGCRPAEVIGYFHEAAQYSVRFSDGAVESHPAANTKKLLA